MSGLQMSEFTRQTVDYFYQDGQYAFAYQTIANELPPGSAAHTSAAAKA